MFVSTGADGRMGTILWYYVGAIERNFMPGNHGDFRILAAERARKSETEVVLCIAY